MKSLGHNELMKTWLTLSAGSVRSQGISSHGINLGNLECSSFSTRKIGLHWNVKVKLAALLSLLPRCFHFSVCQVNIFILTWQLNICMSLHVILACVYISCWHRLYFVKLSSKWHASLTPVHVWIMIRYFFSFFDQPWYRPFITSTGLGFSWFSSTRDHFVFVPSKWETTLQCNVICHSLGAYPKWSLLRHVLTHWSLRDAGCNFISVLFKFIW